MTTRLTARRNYSIVRYWRQRLVRSKVILPVTNTNAVNSLQQWQATVKSIIITTIEQQYPLDSVVLQQSNLTSPYVLITRCSNKLSSRHLLFLYRITMLLYCDLIFNYGPKYYSMLLHKNYVNIIFNNYSLLQLSPCINKKPVST